MDLLLTRDPLTSGFKGIFGRMTSQDGQWSAFTLEHAYKQTSGIFSPKIPAGTYLCKRGMHKLNGMTDSFSTFELQNVPNCSGILIHRGNFNNDSEGCILIGKNLGLIRIMNSAVAFQEFMVLQEGVEEFNLTIC